MGAKHMARKLGDAVCLAVAAVCHGEDGGDRRDRVTVITSERLWLRGEEFLPADRAVLFTTLR